MLRHALSCAFLAMLALMAPAPTAAYDFRQLIEFSPSKYASGDAFCEAWLNACRTYKPKDPNLFYVDSLCRPGDYQGSHTNTEALASCVFEKSVAVGVAEELGVEII
ncbi:hypothetical protein BS47DRAFT_1335208 [Hydnum rufescens UP504]|uniref:Uncharacterized protein n=1 Tax=Hydnum rufescens UP504 TaxID=1448309 RepID=A0A9P6E2S6_9AGAM|nr:hypothetical protein BS47DRAFT_1335208 [Hydnum rufescens UP504]